MRLLIAYRGIQHAPGWATGDHLVDAAVSEGHDVRAFGYFYGAPSRRLPRQMEHGWEPELVIHLECGDGDPQYDLHYLQCPRVYWDFDTALKRDFFSSWLREQAFDRVFFANSSLIPPLWPDAIWLPYATPRAFIAASNGVRRGVWFVGEPRTERLELAAAGVSFAWNMYGEEYARFLGHAVACVHSGCGGGSGLVPMRPYEAWGAGAVLLAPDSPEMREVATPGQHWIAYEGLDDLREHVAKLRAAPSSGIGIATTALSNVIDRHTYVHRLRTILESL